MNFIFSFLTSHPIGIPLGIFILLFFALNFPFMLFYTWQGVFLVLGDFNLGRRNKEKYQRLTKDGETPIKIIPHFVPSLFPNLWIGLFFELLNPLKYILFIGGALYFAYQFLRQIWLLGVALEWGFFSWVGFIVSVIVVFFISWKIFWDTV